MDDYKKALEGRTIETVIWVRKDGLELILDDGNVFRVEPMSAEPELWIELIETER